MAVCTILALTWQTCPTVVVMKSIGRGVRLPGFPTIQYAWIVWFPVFLCVFYLSLKCGWEEGLWLCCINLSHGLVPWELSTSLSIQVRLCQCLSEYTQRSWSRQVRQMFLRLAIFTCVRPWLKVKAPGIFLTWLMVWATVIELKWTCNVTRSESYSGLLMSFFARLLSISVIWPPKISRAIWFSWCWCTVWRAWGDIEEQKQAYQSSEAPRWLKACWHCNKGGASWQLKATR